MLGEHVGTLLAAMLIAPLAGAVVNGLGGRRLAQRTVSLVGVGAPLLAFVAAVLATLGLAGREAVSVTLLPWIHAGPVHADVALWLDPLSALMSLVVTGVGTIIHAYSVGYMRGDPSYARYFSHLNLFLFSMLLLVLGRNLPVVFVGWEGVGLCSYLLIGFWFDDTAKAIAGKKAFIVNRIGDFGFLVAMFALAFWMGGSLDVPALREAVEAGRLEHGGTGVTLVTLALFLGATGKSAQIPLYVWLPDAMAGPTPVSALIHAATMVTAGVYMVARLHFLFALAPVTLVVVSLIGAATALWAACIALAQNDIKKVLAYSTVSQLGYMVMAAGRGAFSAAMFHLTTHAFFKACLFLGAGSVIHALRGEQDIRRMGGLGRHMPVTRGTFLVAALAIAGVPPLSGFFSKEERLYRSLVLEPAVGQGLTFVGPVCLAAGLCAAFMTAAYVSRLYLMTFAGEQRFEAHPHESPPVMTAPLVFLAAGSALIGLIGLPPHGLLHRWLDPVFRASVQGFVEVGSHALEWGLMAVSSLVAVAGIATAHALWRGRWAGARGRLASSFLGRLLAAGGGVDALYHALFVRPFVLVSAWVSRVLDSGLVDGLLVGGPPRVLTRVGGFLRLAANGDVQAYAAALLAGLAVLLWLMG